MRDDAYVETVPAEDRGPWQEQDATGILRLKGTWILLQVVGLAYTLEATHTSRPRPILLLSASGASRSVLETTPTLITV